MSSYGTDIRDINSSAVFSIPKTAARDKHLTPRPPNVLATAATHCTNSAIFSHHLLHMKKSTSLTHLGGFDGIVLVVDRGCWACHVVNLVNFRPKRLSDVMSHELKVGPVE